MSLVNQSKIDAAQIGFSTRFNRALSAVEDPALAIAMEIPSDTKTEDHDWLGTVPGMTEWVDDRKMKQLRAENVRIVNKDWANGLVINRNDILDDRLGIVNPMIDELARKAGLHWGKLVVDALVAGFSTSSAFGTAYDGVAFFSASHPVQEAGGVQSNTTASALSDTTYFSARAAMWSYTDDEGDPLGIAPDTLIVGPSLEKTAREITQADIVESSGGAGVRNVLQNTARVIVSPRLVGAAASHWFLCSLSQAVKPIILQIREPISPDEPDRTDEFARKVIKFGASGRGNVGYGLWQFAYGSNA